MPGLIFDKCLLPDGWAAEVAVDIEDGFVQAVRAGGSASGRQRIAGIALRLTNERFFRRVAILLYLAMGWLCVGWVVPLYRMVGLVPISLMFAGGLSYTGGLLFYRWERLPFSRPIWHVCVVVGSTAFFLAISRFLQM